MEDCDGARESKSISVFVCLCCYVCRFLILFSADCCACFSSVCVFLFCYVRIVFIPRCWWTPIVYVCLLCFEMLLSRVCYVFFKLFHDGRVCFVVANVVLSFDIVTEA